MKKFFKKGLFALTLIADMTFAAPQDASAKKTNAEENRKVALAVCEASPVQYYCVGNNGCVYWILSDGTIVEYVPYTDSYRTW